MNIPDLDYSTGQQIPDPHSQIFYSVEDDQHSLQLQSEIKKHHNTYQQDFMPILEDKILKKTMNLAWNHRYFVLTRTRLLYYTTCQMTEVKGCFDFRALAKYNLQVKEELINLRLILIVNFVQKGEKYSKQLIILNFQQLPHRYQIWRKQIIKILKNITQDQQNQCPPVKAKQIIHLQQKIHCHNFWNRIKISSNELIQYAEHLDIIFFKSLKPIAAFHRVLMRSSFDHVGLLLKDSNNKLLILEAIQSRGVWVSQWDEMLPIFKQIYEEIAVRKLVLAKNCKIDFEKLQGYISTVIGRKYELSISKLMLGETISTNQNVQQDYRKQNKQNMRSFNINCIKKSQKSIQYNQYQAYSKGREERSEKTYFCSQLVADFYIKFGLIKGRKRNQFWPRDFQSQIKLENGAMLGSFLYVDF